MQKTHAHGFRVNRTHEKTWRLNYWGSDRTWLVRTHLPCGQKVPITPVAFSLSRICGVLRVVRLQYYLSVSPKSLWPLPHHPLFYSRLPRGTTNALRVCNNYPSRYNPCIGLFLYIDPCAFRENYILSSSPSPRICERVVRLWCCLSMVPRFAQSSLSGL